MSALGMTLQEASGSIRDFLTQWQLEARSALHEPGMDEATRRRRLVQLRNGGVGELREIKRQYELGRQYAVAEWRRRQFGPPSLGGKASPEAEYAVQRSYREAYQLAAGVTTSELAARLLWRAYVTHDDLLARAVALVADEQDWMDVLDLYGAIQTGASSLPDERRGQRARWASEDQEFEAKYAEGVDFVENLAKPTP
jgi:hypothetical protein